MRRRFILIGIALSLLIALIIPANPISAEDTGTGNYSSNLILDNHQRVSPEQKQEAADRFWAAYFAALTQQSLNESITGEGATLDPGGIPHYFGPYPNWAFSPLPTGAITILTLTAGGSGYTAPVISIIDLYGSGAGASATATVSGGVITGLTLVSGGSNYTAPTVAIVDATGTGAAATATIGGTLSGGIRKFIDSLPTLGPAGMNNLGQYLPVAVADINTYPNSDYYEIALVEYSEKLHTDLPPTILRGYVQLSTTEVPGAHIPLMNPDGSPILLPDGSQAYGVDNPHYLGPTIVAQRDTPTRILFYNLLPIGADGDLFLPVDTSVMGSGPGPVMDMGTGQPIYYTENRAAVHLHGNNTVWISDGTPHQWITPANENTPYPKGVSVADVPDMPSPGAGRMTIYYTNQQSARLMFYHDHAYGITRLNVYAGEAAGYVISDQVEQDMINGTNNTGVNPGMARVLPDIGIPLIIQDKTFVDANTIANEDPTWGWGLDALGNPITGSLWYPHVYMPAQNPYDISGGNPFGRWHYGPWFWPPTTDVTYPPVANPYYDPVNAPWEPPMMPGTPNPSTPGEGFMDTMMVNGTAYPYLEVQPQAYRFRILNAANDRFVNLQWYLADPTVTTADGRVNTEVKMVPAAPTAGFPADWPTDGREGGVPDPATAGPSWIQIGTEGGFMPAPVIVPNQPIGYNENPTAFNFGNVDRHSLLLGSAERADVIVDFSAYAGQTLILYNDAPTAFPANIPQYDFYTGAPDRMNMGGAPTIHAGYGPNVRTVMQVRVAGVAGTQTRVVATAPNAVSPGETANITAEIFQFPGPTKVVAAGLPVTFNYVTYLLQTGTTQTGTATVNTDALGNATLSLVTPTETSLILVDAVYFGSTSLFASSDTKIISVLPVIEANITASATLGSIIFHLGDQYGNPLSGQTLTFLTTAGALSAASGVTNTNGDVTVSLSGADSAVVSASFGGYINAFGWAYQPTMARITVETVLTSNVQTRVVTTAPNIVSPGDSVNITASLYQLPGVTKISTSGLPVMFNYVMFLLESATSTSGTTTINTDASGNAVLGLVAPNEASVILVDAIFLGSGTFLPSSNMKIVSALPVIGAKVTATSTLGNIIFHLADQWGNPIAGQTLTFLTTSGSLSTGVGVTNAGGDVAVTLSGTISAVVSGSFGGYISPQGWAYQPALGRIGVSTTTVTGAPTYDITMLNAVFAKTDTKRGVFEVSQEPIIIPQAEYNSAYNSIFPSDPPSVYVQQIENSKTFMPLGSITSVTVPIQPKAIQDEMGETYDEFGRMSSMLGLELPVTGGGVQAFIMYPYASPPVDVVKGSVYGTQIGTLGDGTQIWRITHNGVDTHTVHFHLFNVQLINRVAWDGALIPPDANELGWKETIRVNPLEHTVVALRPYIPVVPFDIPNSIRLLNPAMPAGAVLPTPPGGHLDPLANPIDPVLNHFVNLGWEYVYHCHLLAHEEMDMMHAVAFALPPLAPSGLNANVLSNPVRVNLTWTDNSRNETGWIVQRSLSGADIWTNIAEFASTTGPETLVTISYSDTGLTAGSYDYRVIAKNVVGETSIPNFPTITVESGPSGVASATIP